MLIQANQTYIGSTVTMDKPSGPVSVESGSLIVSRGNGVFLGPGFEVKQGAEFEIK